MAELAESIVSIVFVSLLQLTYMENTSKKMRITGLLLSQGLPKILRLLQHLKDPRPVCTLQASGHW